MSTNDKTNDKETAPVGSFDIETAIRLILKGEPCHNWFGPEGSVKFRAADARHEVRQGFKIMHDVITENGADDVGHSLTSFRNCFPHDGWMLGKREKPKMEEPQRMKICPMCDGAYCGTCDNKGEVPAEAGRDIPPAGDGDGSLTDSDDPVEVLAARIAHIETAGLRNLEMRVDQLEKHIQALDAQFVDYRKGSREWENLVTDRLDGLGQFRNSCKEWVDRVQAASSDSQRRVDALEKAHSNYRETATLWESGVMKRFDALEKKMTAEQGCQHTTHNDVRTLRQKLDRMDKDSEETIRRLNELQRQFNLVDEDRRRFPAISSTIATEAPAFVEATEFRQDLPPLARLSSGDWIIPERVEAVRIVSYQKDGKRFMVVVRTVGDGQPHGIAVEGYGQRGAENARKLAHEIAMLANEGRSDGETITEE